VRPDLEVVADLVPRGATVLDLGCGDGSLLEHLARERGCRGSGVEISDEGVHACLERGVPVVQGDIDDGLTTVADRHYDVVVLSQTLQRVRRPAFVMSEMIRVAPLAIVSFPNFAHWPLRLQLVLRGRMPVSRFLPYAWHETPNIHLCTIADFEDLVRRTGRRVDRRILLDSRGRPAGRMGDGWANLAAAAAVYRLAPRDAVSPGEAT
jgi:methionine biosynthesis protein MetW